MNREEIKRETIVSKYWKGELNYIVYEKYIIPFKSFPI